MDDEEEWGPCTSREEWLLMYQRGLSPERIAKLCRVRARVVRRVAQQTDRKDERFFQRRSVVHDQPSLPGARPLLSWQQRYDNLRWFVDTVGRFPTQTGRTWERMCHSFLYLQRHKRHSGSLTAEQLQLLDALGDWYVPPRAKDHWKQRLEAYLRFVERRGRQPRVESEKGSEERSLKVWLWSQRKRAKDGKIPDSQVRLLDAGINGWRLKS